MILLCNSNLFLFFLVFGFGLFTEQIDEDLVRALELLTPHASRMPAAEAPVEGIHTVFEGSNFTPTITVEDFSAPEPLAAPAPSVARGLLQVAPPYAGPTFRPQR